MSETIRKLGRRLRLGVIGGGPGSFIGEVHRSAARLDNHYEVVASVLSSNPERSAAAGRGIGIPEGRAYGTAEDLFAAEAAREDGIDALAVMTPNDSHYSLACQALENGLDVICDKPMTHRLADAVDLVDRVRKSGLVFCCTFNYTGYPMVRQARAMVKAGEIGEIRVAQVEYLQPFFTDLMEPEKGGEANWRWEADRGGASLVLGDIGSHAHHMLGFVTGLKVSRLTADVAAMVPGRRVDDYGSALLHYENGARGVLLVANCLPGSRHGLHFRVYGETGRLEWSQEHPNELYSSSGVGEPEPIFIRGGAGLHPEGQRGSRVALGHPEGYQEAFANLYVDAAAAIVARRLGETVDPLALDFPTVEDGARGMKFIQAAVDSQNAGGAWTDCTLDL